MRYIIYDIYEISVDLTTIEQDSCITLHTAFTVSSRIVCGCNIASSSSSSNVAVYVLHMIPARP